jgi:hypothetical protein
MASLQAMGLRVTALEARVAEVETSFGESIYRLERDSVATRLDLATILASMGLPAATAEQVDEVLNAR